MNICFVTEHYPPHIGGVEIVFWEYANRLVSHGHDVTVLTSDSAGAIGMRDESGVKVHRIKSTSFFGHPLLPKSQIDRFIQKADIVHTTTFTAALPALSLSKKYRKPCIIMAHEVLSKKWFSIEKNPLMALCFLLFERFILCKPYTIWQVPSKATQKDIKSLGIPQEKTRLIYYGINTEIWKSNISPKNLTQFLGFSPLDKIFLYMGRPGKSKGVFVLLKTIIKIQKKLPPQVKFGFILSTKPEKERSRFERIVRLHKLSNIISIRNPLPLHEIPGYRKAAYTIIVPSQTEGFGFVAAESAQLEVPLIVSDAGSLPEVASGQVLSFRSGDVDDLAQKILLALKGDFQKIPKKYFSWENATREIIHMYKNILKSQK